MNNYLNIIEKNNCFGCGACQNICPVDAIYMQEDEEGFLYPCLDEQKCIKCDKCKQVCPVLNKNETNSLPNEVLAGYSDDEERIKSSSGGIFPLLAKYILEEKKGFVCGAAFGEDLKVYHTIISDYADIDKLRGSKYVQSEIKDIFNQIKNLLKENKYVLFSGTPCQVAGLKLFLEKDYERLLTVDVVCHGVPPASLFKKYLDETFKDDKIISFNFRDKELHGWSAQAGTAVTANYSKISNNDFFDGFEQNLYLRPSCGECKFASRKRVSDITIGDFWGIWDYEKVLSFQKEGVSLVAATTAKGAEIVEKIKLHLAYQNSVPLKYAKPNYPLYRPSIFHSSRQQFFNRIKTASFYDSLKYAMGEKFDIAIMGLWYAGNYGGFLTYWALYKFLEHNNYTAILVDNCPMIENHYVQSGHDIMIDFVKKYKLSYTSPIKHRFELYNLNDMVEKFIVGSDQIWNYRLTGSKYQNYFFDFVNSSKQKISYATSFGYNSSNAPESCFSEINYYLERFDGISIRENNGLDILKNDFNIDFATQVLDPVFLIPECFDELIANSLVEKDGEFIFAYILDLDEEKMKILKHVSEKLNQKLILLTDINPSIANIKEKYNNINIIEGRIEDWLFYIKNSSFVITDSFHSVCFSIIYKKQFICIKNPGRGVERFVSLLKKFNLTEKMIANFNDLYENEKLFIPINYIAVQEMLEKEKENSSNWLLNKLKEEKQPNFSEIDVFNKEISKLEEKYIKTKKALLEMTEKATNIEIIMHSEFAKINRNLLEIEKNRPQSLKETLHKFKRFIMGIRKL